MYISMNDNTKQGEITMLVKKVKAVGLGYSVLIVDADGNGYRVAVVAGQARGGNESARAVALTWIADWEDSDCTLEDE
jgi:hypothetical protein